MILLILIVIIFLIIFLFTNAGILLWVKKLFKIEKPSYKNSLKILIITGIVIFTVSIIFGIINLGFLSNIFGTVITFFVFHYFLKRYYQNSWKKSLGIYAVYGIITFILSLSIAFPVRHFIVLPFTVDGDTMSPTYNAGDYLLINKFDKQFARGDVIVFQLERWPGTFFIKRIIGLPSDKVEIQNGKVFINGKILDENYYNGDTPGNVSVTLGQDQCFVLGDNRNKSFDSRNFGPVPKSSIEGKVFYKVSGLIK